MQIPIAVNFHTDFERNDKQLKRQTNAVYCWNTLRWRDEAERLLESCHNESTNKTPITELRSQKHIHTWYTVISEHVSEEDSKITPARPFPRQLVISPTSDLHLHGSWPQLAKDWKSRFQAWAEIVRPTAVWPRSSIYSFLMILQPGHICCITGFRTKGNFEGFGRKRDSETRTRTRQLAWICLAHQTCKYQSPLKRTLQSVNSVCHLADLDKAIPIIILSSWATVGKVPLLYWCQIKYSTKELE